jgi:hypothetical protein
VIHKNAAVSHIANETLSAKGFLGFAWAEGTTPTVLVHGRVQQHGKQQASIRATESATTRFVVFRMRNLRAILNSDVAYARAELAKHIEKITLTPNGESYIASGTWNFVGRGSISGAGGPVCTTRATEFSFSLAA